MGYRLHSRTVNRIEYSDGAFNAKCVDDLGYLLCEDCNEVWINESGDQMEMPKKDFSEMIQKLREMPEETVKKKYPNLYASCRSKDRLCEHLQSLLDVSEKNDNTIFLKWF